MKILIPVLGFGKAGGYRVLSKIADELINRHHEVAFLCPDRSATPYYPTKGLIYWIENKNKIVTVKKISIKQDNAFQIQLKLMGALKKIASQYDIILANHSLTIIPIKLAGLLKKTVYYIQAYEPDYYEQQGGIKNKILSYLSRSTYSMGVFTIVNAEIYRHYKKLFCERVLYPGIDFSIFYPKKENANQKENIVIGTVGGGAIYKGTNYVIEAFREIKAKYRNAILLIAFGNIELEKQEGVKCIYPDGDEELGNFYRQLDYYICANYSQTGAFHYPVVEAMACSTPVITTKYYPTNEFNSWQINNNDKDDIIRQFENAFHNDAHCAIKVKRGVHDVVQFNWHLFGEKMERYLLEAIKNR